MNLTTYLYVVYGKLLLELNFSKENLFYFAIEERRSSAMILLM